MIKRCAIVAPTYTIAPHAILQAFAEARGAEVKGGTIFCSMMPYPDAAEARKCEDIAAYYG